jgi:hypothetical protein
MRPVHNPKYRKFKTLWSTISNTQPNIKMIKEGKKIRLLKSRTEKKNLKKNYSNK